MPSRVFKFLVPALAAVAAAWAGPVDSAIVAAMKLPEAPNYSWRTEVADDARTYEIVGATDRATDFSLVTMPVATAAAPRRGPRSPGATSNVTTVIFKGAEHYVVQWNEEWRRPEELPTRSDQGDGRRSGGFGGPPGMGGPRPRGSRGGSRSASGGEGAAVPAYSNLQNTLSRPHEEIALIVAGATDLKVEGDVVTGSLPENTAVLLLIHAGQNNITPLQAGGAVRLWVRGGVLVKYETRLEGVLSVTGAAGRQQVKVQQTATTTLTEVGTTRFEIPAEARKKLGG